MSEVRPQMADFGKLSRSARRRSRFVALAILVAGATLNLPVHAGAAEPVTARLTAPQRPPYAGEVFDVDLTLEVTGERRTELVGTPTLEGRNLVVEPFGKPSAASGREGSGVRFRARAVASEPGTIEIGPARQDVRIDSGRRVRRDPFEDFFRDSGFPRGMLEEFMGDVFSQREMITAEVTADPVPLQVQPLPQPAPAGFSGAVGQFQLESHLVPAQPKVGEPITWTLTLRGTGNWPRLELPARTIPAELRAVKPTRKKDFAEGAVFSGAVSEDLVLIPTKAGTFSLAPIDFVYFDPESGSYETARVDVPALQIAGGPQTAQAPSSSTRPQALNATSSPSSVTGFAPSAHNPAPGNEPLPLPHDPKAESVLGRAPFEGKAVLVGIAVPGFALAMFWLFLAWKRADATDPQRLRRRALIQLRQAVVRIRGSSVGPERNAALLDWQRAAATLFAVDVAAPTGNALAEHVPPKLAKDWREIWDESDAALYADGGELPADWAVRAARIAGTSRAPRRRPLRALHPRHLVPAAAATALALAIVSNARADAIDDYRAADFGAAREAWSKQVGEQPLDAAARYNLGLAEAQVGNVPRAFAETGAAFLLAPRDESARWNVGALATRLPAADPALVELARGGGTASLARMASVATWQVLLVAGVALLCVGIATALWHRHRKAELGSAPAFAAWTGSFAVAFGLIVAAAAGLSLLRYGPLAHPNAAVVATPTILRSVPTDADTTQSQRPLPPGAVVTTGRAFLGWTRVVFAGGESGWVRDNDLVRMYESGAT